MAERPLPGTLRAGLALLGAVLLGALLIPLGMPDPLQMDLSEALRPPSRAHWLGTDALGRDLASRVLHGGRLSLTVGLLSTAIALLIGLPLGGWAGYRGGWADSAVSRAVEAVMTLPRLLLLMALVAVAPPSLEAVPPTFRIAVVLGVVGWARVARYLRAEFARLSGSEVVAAARAAGAGPIRIATIHLLPASLAPVLITASFSVGSAITGEAALSFLGLGLDPPAPSWGALLLEARSHVREAWWLALFPGLALFVTVLACTWTGEGLRDRLDPRSGTP